MLEQLRELCPLLTHNLLKADSNRMDGMNRIKTKSGMKTKIMTA
jgi:hypothetical protein